MGITRMDLHTEAAARKADFVVTTPSARVSGATWPRMSLTTSQETPKKGGHRLQDMADKANHATQELERKAVNGAQDVATFCGLIQMLLVLAVDRAPSFRHGRTPRSSLGPEPQR